MNSEEALKVFEKVGAVITGSHFLLASGLHSSRYFNKDALFPHTTDTSQLCRHIAIFADSDIRVVAGPAIGGTILSQWVAYHLSDLLKVEVLAVYAEPGPGDTMIFKRGYDKFISGSKVLVVEDVLTTGGSAKKVVNAVRALGGEVRGVSVLCNRGGVTVEDLGVPWLHALATLPMESYAPDDCPFCRDGVPLTTDVGRGR